MQDFIKITPFHILGEDERGITANFTLSRAQADFIMIERKVGSLSGNTYHEGKNNGTNPKIFILLSGQIELSHRVVGQTEKEVTRITAPAVIEIQPKVVHAVLALTHILMLEGNAIADIQADRIKEKV